MRLLNKIILFGFLLLQCISSEATTVTKTVCESGCDYSTLNSAVDYFETNYPDFVSSTVNGVITISGVWSSADTTAVGVSLTTNSKYFLTIQTTGDARHSGIYNNNTYRLEVDVYNTSPLNFLSANYTVIDGIQIKGGNSTYGVVGSTGCIIKNNIVTDADGVGVYVRDVSSYVYNNVIFANGGHGIHASPDNYSSFWIYSNTIVGNGGYGINCVDNYNRGVDSLINNLCINNSSGDYSISSSYNDVFSNNGSSDTSGNSGLQNLVATTEFAGSSDSPPDYHLKSGATSINSGYDLFNILPVDIDGEARPEGSYGTVGDNPTMTSNTTPIGTASASSEANSENAAWCGLDKNSGTKWTPNGTTGWIAYEFPSTSEVIEEYKITGCISGQENMAPKDWTFDGYNGSSWTTIDTQTSQTSWTAGEERTYNSFVNSTAYQKYRINVTANNGHGTYMTIVQWTMTDSYAAYSPSTEWDIGMDEFFTGTQILQLYFKKW